MWRFVILQESHLYVQLRGVFNSNPMRCMYSAIVCCIFWVLIMRIVLDLCCKYSDILRETYVSLSTFMNI